MLEKPTAKNSTNTSSERPRLSNLLTANTAPAELLADSFFISDVEGKGPLVLFALGVLLLKPLATGATIGAGGNGGIFAPSLFVGGFAGYIFAEGANLLNVGKTLSVSNFTLVGMCGVMSGVLHAPLTAIFLIAEITSGYTLFLPLMLVSAIALSTNSYFNQWYQTRLDADSLHLTRVE